MKNKLFCTQIRARWLSDWFILPMWWGYDRIVQKRSNCWAFFDHPLKPGQFVENSRAVFEAVKRDPHIHKLIFTRNVGAEFYIDDACNTEIIDIQSLQGLLVLAHCGVYLLTNAVAMDMSWRWPSGGFSVLKPDLKRRILINLWHSISLKRLFALANEQQRKRADRVALRRKERAFYKGLIASSDVDSYAMSAMFYPINYERIWLTGLPRNDFLKMEYHSLPRFLRREVELIRQLKRGRRLIVYAPTYRENELPGAECYQFNSEEVRHLKSLMRRCNAVLGFRMHYFRNGSRLFNLEEHFDGEVIIDLGHSVIKEIAPLLREADLVLTDYSSVYIDALYIEKPVISFAYDLQHYHMQQNGLLYDMGLVFPGPVVSDFESLLAVMEDELITARQVSRDHYRLCRKFFFNYLDAGNTQRVLDKLKLLGAF